MRGNGLRGAVRTSVLAGIVFGAVAALPDEAHAVPFFCQVDQVVEFTTTNARVGVHCANSIVLNGQTIRFIGVSPTAGSTARFVQLATSALLSGRIFLVDIPNTSAGGVAGGISYPANVSGCVAADCRTPAAFSLI